LTREANGGPEAELGIDTEATITAEENKRPIDKSTCETDQEPTRDLSVISGLVVW